ncbi:hypothetical protein ES703_104560 [subsurface metagenome]
MRNLVVRVKEPDTYRPVVVVAARRVDNHCQVVGIVLGDQVVPAKDCDPNAHTGRLGIANHVVVGPVRDQNTGFVRISHQQAFYDHPIGVDLNGAAPVHARPPYDRLRSAAVAGEDDRATFGARVVDDQPAVPGGPTAKMNRVPGQEVVSVDRRKSSPGAALRGSGVRVGAVDAIDVVVGLHCTGHAK